MKIKSKGGLNYDSDIFSMTRDRQFVCSIVLLKIFISLWESVGACWNGSSYWIILKHAPPKLSSLIAFPMATLTSFSVLLDNEGEIIIAYNSTYIFYFVLGPWFHVVSLARPFT